MRKQWAVVQVVVDTSVIGWAPESADDWVLLEAIMARGHVLGVDYGGEILDEYYDHVDFSLNSPVGPWFAVMLQRLIWLSGELTESEITQLDAAGCDDDDYPFIGVATRTDSHLLFHRDRGYDQTEIRREALAALGIRPYRAAQALAESIV